MQALHFCYGLGAFVAPMIAEPFLNSFDCTPLVTTNKGQLSELERLIEADQESEMAR
jgi:hypothetical protein